MFTIQGQEEERGRIARELHDTVAQNLRYCKTLCEKPEAEKNLAQIAGCLSKSLAEVRSMSYNLAPPDITKNDFLLLAKNYYKSLPLYLILFLANCRLNILLF